MQITKKKKEKKLMKAYRNTFERNKKGSPDPKEHLLHKKYYMAR